MNQDARPVVCNTQQIIQHRLVVKRSKDASEDLYYPKIRVRCTHDYRINFRVRKEGCNQDYLRVRVGAMH